MKNGHSNVDDVFASAREALQSQKDALLARIREIDAAVELLSPSKIGAVATPAPKRQRRAWPEDEATDPLRVFIASHPGCTSTEVTNALGGAGVRRLYNLVRKGKVRTSGNKWHWRFYLPSQAEANGDGG